MSGDHEPTGVCREMIKLGKTLFMLALNEAELKARFPEVIKYQLTLFFRRMYTHTHLLTYFVKQI